MKTLSICISSYNNLPYISQLIELIDEELSELSDKVEVLIIDDHSDEKNYNLLSALDSKYYNVVIWGKRMKTPSYGRNEMIKEAKGKYILFVDGDDLLTAKISKIIDELETKTDEEILLSFPYFCDEKNRLVDCNIKYCKQLYEVDDKTFAKNSLKYAVHQTGIWNIYKRKFLIDNELMFPTTMRSEDHLFTHNVLAKHPKIGRMSTRYYGWRLNPQSHSNSSKVRENNIKFLEYALANISPNLDEQTRNEIIFNLFNTTLSNMIRGYPQMSGKERKAYFKKIRYSLKDVKYSGDYHGTDIYFLLWYKYKMRGYLLAELLYQIYQKKHNVKV
ncbi:MAG: glycosyltransferase family 2 protein [Mycoplasmatales bacterium]